MGIRRKGWKPGGNKTEKVKARWKLNNRRRATHEKVKEGITEDKGRQKDEEVEGAGKEERSGRKEVKIKRRPDQVG